MLYISKAKREATLWLTRLELIKLVQEATGYDENGTYKQISEAIEDRELPVVWGDLLESFWKKGGSGFAVQIADKPTRNPQFWRQGAFDPADPRKGQFDPDDADRMFVGWNFESFDIDEREPEPRFRKPMFWRAKAEEFWPVPDATARDEKKAVDFLTPLVKADPELPFQKALDMCCKEIAQLSEYGFRYRILPKAREAAGLPKTGVPGRRKRQSC